MRNIAFEDMDRQSLFHPMTSIADHLRNGPAIYSRAHGVWIQTHDGRRLVDMGAGLWCVNVGYGREEIAEAAKEAMLNLSYYHLFGSASNELSITLADRLLGLARDQGGAESMSKVFFGTSGSEANDTAFKLVRYYNNLRGKEKKKKIISRLGGYHGVTLASGSLTGIPAYHHAFDMPIDGVVHVSFPHYYSQADEGESEADFTDRLIAEIELTIEQEGADTIAGFIAEPLIGTGGVAIPPAGYFLKLRRLLDHYDILLIADEVITGFGRTGEWFGSKKYSCSPDIMTMAKGLTSAYFPVSAVVVSQGIWDMLEAASERNGVVMHGFTYGGHPVGAAVAHSNLDIIEREKLVSLSALRGDYLLARLREHVSDLDFVGDVRGTGLMAAVEFVADKSTRRNFRNGCGPHRVVAKKAAEYGVLTRALPYIDVNSFSPPLTISEEEIDEAVNRYSAAIKAVLPDLRALASG
ncbi:aspartate aminotransferase family protein [Microvirga zambiensis]|uniref:aminotransferase family protein n=1 Tax=Microvirga zambiensis TaxID=1402137 RepID=UPI00191DC54D|nr:aminotransferase [Microvirga zambiensis]